MGFANNTYLWALFSLLLPLLIHLWNKKERKVILVGSLKFFSQVPPRKIKNIRLSDKRLLVLRMLILAIVSLIMAGLYWKSNKLIQKQNLLIIEKSLYESEREWTEKLQSRYQNKAVEIVNPKPDWENFLKVNIDAQHYDSVYVYHNENQSLMHFSGFEMPFYTEFHSLKKNQHQVNASWLKGDSLFIYEGNQPKVKAYSISELPKGFELKTDSLFINGSFIKKLISIKPICISRKEENEIADAIWKTIMPMKGIDFQLNENKCQGFQVYSLDEFDKEIRADLMVIWDDKSELAFSSEFSQSSLICKINPKLLQQQNQLTELPELMWQLIYKSLLKDMVIIEDTNEKAVLWPHTSLEHEVLINQKLDLWPILLILLMLIGITERWWAHRVMSGKTRG